VSARAEGFPAAARAERAARRRRTDADGGPARLEATRAARTWQRRAPGLDERRTAPLPLRQVLLQPRVAAAVARERVDLASLVAGAQSLLAAAETPDATRLAVGEDLRTLALITLGIGEAWALRSSEADRHLQEGVALARQIGRPYLEMVGLAHRAVVASERSLALAIDQSSQAIELARAHGWADEPVVTVPYLVLATTMVWQGTGDEAERSLEQAKLTLRPEIQPAAHLVLSLMQGALELSRGRDAVALRAFCAAARAGETMAARHPLTIVTQGLLLLTYARLADLERAEQVYAALADDERDSEHIRIPLAALRLAQGDPDAAAAALAPVVAAPGPHQVSAITAFLLEALARDALDDTAAAECALEHALDLAEPDSLLWPFLVHRAPELLERHRRNGSAHAALISEIHDVLAGGAPASPRGEARGLRDPLTASELRVLRYLPTNMSRREIANELYVTDHTVKAHMHHVYAKLGVHRRSEAVERARSLGLLARAAARRR
jgi:LuxR family maltose regulon positive regulatory protein